MIVTLPEAEPAAVGANVTCDFKSGKIILQQPVAREQMSKLLAEGKTELLENFVSNKTRRKFKARHATEFAESHRTDWKIDMWVVEKLEQPIHLLRRIGARNDFENICADPRCGDRFAPQTGETGRVAQLVS